MNRGRRVVKFVGSLLGPSLLPSSVDHDRRFIEAALAASDDCIKVIGLDGSLQYMSEGGQRVMEVDDFNVLRGCPWPDFWQDQGNADAIAAVAAARAGRNTRFTGFASTAKGNRRFWDVKVSPIFSADGSIENILSISRDITALKMFEEQQFLLRNELSHRIKNILALVQAVAHQTLRNGDEMSSARPAFLARLASLGQAHDLLTEASYAATTLRALAEATAQEQTPGRMTVHGTDVDLSPKSSLAFALAFHELATNAIKYGALSNDEGQVSIVWNVEGMNGEDRLDLTWTERGGPAVAEPSRKGFGSLMIERALTSYVDGKAESAYLPTGFVFRLTASLESLKAD